MFYEMRRKDRLLTEKEAREILSEGEYGVLSTMGENGYPYGVPVNYVYLNDNIYFHCAADVGHKLENIKYNNHVCFTVVTNESVLPEALTTKYDSVSGNTDSFVTTVKHTWLLYLIFSSLCPTSAAQ